MMSTVISEKEVSFKDVCEDLDSRHKKYISGSMKTDSLAEVWNKIKNRQDTFLTKK